MSIDLQKFINMQKEFDYKVQKVPYVSKDEWLIRLATAIKGEVVELQEALGYLPDGMKKWWKSSVDYDHVFEESIDILHFLLSLWNRLGVDAKDVWNEYSRKMGINFKRQDENY
jgi:dimeric dUTPase (all-alpha-NTP-PPase superfamily)